MKWLVAVLLMFVCLSTVSAQPEIVGEILPEVKQRDGIAYMNCTVINKDAGSAVMWGKARTNVFDAFIIFEDEQIIWQGNENTAGDSSMLKYTITTRTDGRRITYMLVIRDLIEDDAGDYECIIRQQGIPYYEWPTKIGKLTVLFPPRIQPIQNDMYELNVGDDLDLTCSAYGMPSPNITWKRKDGSELPGGGIQFKGSVMHLQNIQEDDAGIYICVADNNIEPLATLEVDLRVFFEPLCRAVESRVGQAQNRLFNAELRCFCKGYRPPTVTWKKYTSMGNWENINNDDHFDITNDPQEDAALILSTLLVKNVQGNDYTQYRCIGSNNAGEDTKEITLFETSDCQGLYCPSTEQNNDGQTA